MNELLDMQVLDLVHHLTTMSPWADSASLKVSNQDGIIDYLGVWEWETADGGYAALVELLDNLIITTRQITDEDSDMRAIVKMHHKNKKASGIEAELTKEGVFYNGK